MARSRRSSLWARLLFVFPLFAMGGGATFVLTGCECDDDDHDDCDDDHEDHHSTAAPTGAAANLVSPRDEANRLHVYRAVPATDPGAHPYRRLLDIQGISIFSTSPDGQYGKRELRLFTEALLRANPDLIGIPPEAGELVFRDVKFLEKAVLVRFKQTTSLPKPVVTLPRAHVVFVFDPLGHLVQIDNTTRVAPD
jgi:hypothetical protein